MAEQESGSGEQQGKKGGRHGATTLEAESKQARKELDRPAHGLFLSGTMAGLAVGLSLLLMAVVRTMAEGVLSEPVVRLLEANAYTAGFIVVVMAHTDLFTEYTTMTLFPVLGGEAGVRPLARLWGLVLASNVIAAGAVGALVATLAPALGVVEPHVLGHLARGLTDHSAGVIVGSAAVAGWLMGVLSWLVSAGRDTVSQIFFVWLIAFSLGLAELHHSITGTAEVLAGVFAGQGVTWADYGRFLVWAVLGNALGALAFALPMRFSVTIGSTREASKKGLRAG